MLWVILAIIGLIAVIVGVFWLIKIDEFSTLAFIGAIVGASNIASFRNRWNSLSNL